MGLTVSLNLFKSFLCRNGKKIVKEVPQVSQRMTRTMTDPSSGIVRMEREINRNGQDALAILEKFPDGKTKMTIKGGGDNDMWRTKTITREPGASVFGGDKITVEKDCTKYWCFRENINLTKEYNPQGVLEHKELSLSHSSGNGLRDYSHRAVQDKVYNEYPLSSGYKDMLMKPENNRYIKHSLDKNDNYYQFADKDSTAYTRAIQAKEQAAIDAAKKAEAEAIAAKEAAEKAAAELRAKQPRINISKALNKDINDLIVKEIKLADGTIERIFTDPDTGKVLAKTQDLGILHKEWIYGGKADMIYMKQVGDGKPYIIAKKGNYTQLDYVVKQPGYGSDKVREVTQRVQYYNDGQNGLARYAGSGTTCSAKGYVTVYDKTAAQSRADFPALADSYPDYPKLRVWQDRIVYNSYFDAQPNSVLEAQKLLKELNADSKRNFINLSDLYSSYKV